MPDRQIFYYQTSDGRIPFREWLFRLDPSAYARVAARLLRLSEGNFGDFKNLGLGIFELRIHWGPGYRVYYGENRGTLIILLCGGDKKSQPRDIRRALEYWRNYKARQ